MTRIKCETEEQEQMIFIRFLEQKNIKFSSIPNSTFTTSWSQKAKNKRNGLHAGLPDLLLLVPCGDGKKRVVFIEMKRKKGGVLSENQKEWIERINECEEVEAFVCRGSEEAILIIEKLLNLKKCKVHDL